MGGLPTMKNVCTKKGLLYFRRKIAGKDNYIRLPDITDPNFASEYARLSNPENKRSVAGPGTLAILVADFRKSAKYRNIKSPKTKTNKDRYLSMIEKEDGHRSITACARPDVVFLRDRFLDTPGKANNWLTVFRQLMDLAIDQRIRRDNPAQGIEPLDIGEHQPWPKEVIEAALVAATPMMRLAIVTGLYSGARIGDVIKMQHGWHDRSYMQFVTSKGVGKRHRGVQVAIPMHGDWLAAIDAMPRRSITILYDRYGRPFASTKTLQERVRRLIESIGSPTYESNGKLRQYSFHGLRKNAACHLAELRLTEEEIGAICGMTPDTVRHYTKQKRNLTIAQGTTERVQKGEIISLAGGTLK